MSVEYEETIKGPYKSFYDCECWHCGDQLYEGDTIFLMYPDKEKLCSPCGITLKDEE